MAPKVLLGSPINLIKKYILFQWLESLSSLTYTNFDIYLVDNSYNPAFHKGLRNLGFDVDYVPPDGREARVYMCECDNLIRKRCLEGNYDYLFKLECDIFPPVHVIEKLMSRGKPVVGASYWTGHGPDMRPMMLTLIKTGPNQAIARDLTIREYLEFQDGSCKPIFANGNGCILIEREIVKKIPFRTDPKLPGFSDSFFFIDLAGIGILNYVDTSITVDHYNMDWTLVLDDIEHKELERNLLKNEKR